MEVVADRLDSANPSREGLSDSTTVGLQDFLTV